MAQRRKKHFWPSATFSIFAAINLVLCIAPALAVWCYQVRIHQPGASELEQQVRSSPQFSSVCNQQDGLKQGCVVLVYRVKDAHGNTMMPPRHLETTSLSRFLHFREKSVDEQRSGFVHTMHLAHHLALFFEESFLVTAPSVRGIWPARQHAELWPSDIILVAQRDEEDKVSSNSISILSVAQALKRNNYPSSDLRQYGSENAALSALLSGFAISMAILLLERRGSNVSRASRADRHLHRTCVALLILSCALLAIAAALAVIVSGLPSYSLQSLLVYQAFNFGFFLGAVNLFYAIYLALLQNSNRDEFVAARRVFGMVFIGGFLFLSAQAATVPPIVSAFDQGAATYLPFFILFTSGVGFLARMVRFDVRGRSNRPEKILAPPVQRAAFGPDGLTRIREWLCKNQTNGSSDAFELASVLRKEWPKNRREIYWWGIGSTVVVGVVLAGLFVISQYVNYQLIWFAFLASLVWCIAVLWAIKGLSRSWADLQIGPFNKDLGVRDVAEGLPAGVEDWEEMRGKLKDLIKFYRTVFVPFSDYYLVRTELYVRVIVIASLSVAIIAAVFLRFNGSSFEILALLVLLSTLLSYSTLVGHGGIIVGEQEVERGVSTAVISSVEDGNDSLISAITWDGREADRSDTYFLLCAEKLGNENDKSTGSLGKLQLPARLTFLRGRGSESPDQDDELDEQEHIKLIHDKASESESWQVAAILPTGFGEKGIYSAIEPHFATRTSECEGKPNCEVLSYFRRGSWELVLVRHSRKLNKWRVVYYDEDTEIQHSSEEMVARVDSQISTSRPVAGSHSMQAGTAVVDEPMKGSNSGMGPRRWLHYGLGALGFILLAVVRRRKTKR